MEAIGDTERVGICTGLWGAGIIRDCSIILILSPLLAPTCAKYSVEGSIRPGSFDTPTSSVYSCYQLC